MVAKEPNLKEIERKTYISYHQDGLLDIFASLYIVGFSIGILLDFIWDYSFGLFIPGFLVILVLPLWIAAKRKITMPRIGYVKFGTGGKKVTIIFTGLMVVGAFFFLAFALLVKSSSWADFIFTNGLILVGIGGLTISFLFGYATGLKRLYAYGVLALALFVGGHFLSVFFAYLVLMLGVAVMLVGSYLLIQFVRKYPLKGEDSVVQ